MGFIQLVLLEGVLLLSAGIIFFGGIWGTVAATVALSAINVLFHETTQFWNWEIFLLCGGAVGVVLLLIVGRMANKGQFIHGLVGGLISLVFFGAFVTPILALIIWALVVGTGLVPKNKKSQVLLGIAPTILRLILGIVWVICGNILTL